MYFKEGRSSFKGIELFTCVCVEKTIFSRSNKKYVEHLWKEPHQMQETGVTINNRKCICTLKVKHLGIYYQNIDPLQI